MVFKQHVEQCDGQQMARLKSEMQAHIVEKEFRAYRGFKRLTKLLTLHISRGECLFLHPEYERSV